MKNNVNLKYKLFKKGVAALAATMVIGTGSGSFSDALANVSHDHEYVIDIDNEIENEIRLAGSPKKEVELKEFEEKSSNIIHKQVKPSHSVKINPVNLNILISLKNIKNAIVAADNNCINKKAHKFVNSVKKIYTKNEQNGIHNLTEYKICKECGKIKMIKTTEQCEYVFKSNEVDGVHMECPKCGSEKVIEKNKPNPNPNPGGGSGGSTGGGGSTTPSKPEADRVISTTIVFRPNNDGTHNKVKVEKWLHGRVDEIVLAKNISCNMGAWTNNGAAGEIRTCLDCGYEETRNHDLSGAPQDNYTYIGKDEYGNYIHQKTSAVVCPNCGYIDEKNPVNEICTYASDATLNADGLTIENTCERCHEKEELHKHNLKVTYAQKDPYAPDRDVCGTKTTECTDPNCNYDKDGIVGNPYIKVEDAPHVWVKTNGTIIDVGGGYQMVPHVCENCDLPTYIKMPKPETTNLEAETNKLEEKSNTLSTLRRYKECLLNVLNVDKTNNKTKILK